MNQAAYVAVIKAWQLTVKARALCPWTDECAIGITGYGSPPWYREHGAVYFVNLANPLTAADVKELQQIGGFINRSFVISIAAILEAYGVVPYRISPDTLKAGGKHALLTKYLRNRFAHGQWEYDPNEPTHVETRILLEELFPNLVGEAGFVMSIDGLLEPLKDGVLSYIAAAT